MILAVGGRELGREAADEAFIRAYTSWGQVTHYSNAQGSVYRVAVNWARSELRQLRRRLPVRDEMFELHDPEIHAELIACLLQLPDRQRMVVVARFLLDWSIADTAGALGIPVKTVKTLQRRALANLSKQKWPSSEH